MYGGYGFYYYDPTYILVIICAIISLFASARVQSTFNKYNRVLAASGLTGAQAAERILHSAGIYDVSIEHVRGNLSDHYDPSHKVLRLSDSTYNSRSVAAIGVAAHECGHAIQHQQEYGPLNLRSLLVPISNIGSKAAIPLILIGCILSYNQTLIQIGIFAFSFAVIFQLVTLPVEFNASSRALVLLGEQHILDEYEVPMTRKVLRAAAMTYVAAAAASIIQLLRLILLFGGRRRD
ncbi:MAG: zinc metallopeptidase [Lachnospiraceae bacterium]|nr:zinc metallopeptidase [Lachnospiraceae bacterium]